MSLLAYKNYLAHHGIKGQKWGIRRYQNEDGSLTPEGRERYGVTDEKYDANRILNDSEYSKNAIGKYSKMLNDQADLTTEEFNKLTESRKKDYDDFYKNKDLVIKEGLKYLEDAFGVGTDDEEYLDMVVEDFLDYSAPLSKKSESLSKSYQQAKDDYYNSAESLVNHLVGNLKNQDTIIKKEKIVAKSNIFGTSYKKVPYEEKVSIGKKVIDDIFSHENNKSNAQFIHYLRNHEEMAYNPYINEDMSKETAENYREVKKALLDAYNRR